MLTLATKSLHDNFAKHLSQASDVDELNKAAQTLTTLIEEGSINITLDQMTQGGLKFWAINYIFNTSGRKYYFSKNNRDYMERLFMVRDLFLLVVSIRSGLIKTNEVDQSTFIRSAILECLNGSPIPKHDDPLSAARKEVTDTKLPPVIEPTPEVEARLPLPQKRKVDSHPDLAHPGDIIDIRTDQKLSDLSLNELKILADNLRQLLDEKTLNWFGMWSPFNPRYLIVTDGKKDEIKIKQLIEVLLMMIGEVEVEEEEVNITLEAVLPPPNTPSFPQINPWLSASCDHQPSQ